MRVEDPQKLIQDGNKLVEFGESYLTCVNKIYQTTEELANSSWKGEKATKYINEIEEYRQPLTELGNLLSTMGQGIVSAGNALAEFESNL